MIINGLFQHRYRKKYGRQHSEGAASLTRGEADVFRIMKC